MDAEGSKVMHDLCSLHASDHLYYFALDFVDEAAILEQHGNEVGLSAFEWCDVLDPEYRRSTWIRVVRWCD